MTCNADAESDSAFLLGTLTPGYNQYEIKDDKFGCTLDVLLLNIINNLLIWRTLPE